MLLAAGELQEMGGEREIEKKKDKGSVLHCKGVARLQGETSRHDNESISRARSNFV